MERLDIIPGEYKTTTSKIFITFDNKKLIINTTYKIDRKNLRLTNIGDLKDSEDDIVFVEKDICEVVEHKDLYQYIKIIYEMQVLIIKSKNKI